MVDVHIIPDDLYHNIFARLPAKPLSLSRCISKHWNRIISDPYFMKSRPSRRKMLVFSPHLSVYDGTERVVDDYFAYSEDRLGNYYFKYLMKCANVINILGTFNGIVFLVVRKRTRFVEMTGYSTYYMMLCNPFTAAFKILPDPYSTSDDMYRLHGFCGGATMDDDLKIVRFRDYKDHPNYSWNTYDVINIKTGSWSTSEIAIQDAKLHKVDRSGLGMFINGFLYWLAKKKIVVLNVKDMVISEVSLPFPDVIAPILGTLHGCLCMITPKGNELSEVVYYEREFNMWVMKKEHGVENPWSILRSFEFLHECDIGPLLRILKIMGDGRILVWDSSRRAIIFDTLKNSYKRLNTPGTISLYSASAIEYDESLISPSDICGF